MKYVKGNLSLYINKYFIWTSNSVCFYPWLGVAIWFSVQWEKFVYQKNTKFKDVNCLQTLVGLKSKVWFSYPHIIRSLYTHIVDAIMDWKLNKCMSFFTPKLCSIFSGIEMYSKINISIEQNSSCEDSRTLATAATRYNITTMSAEPSLYYSHSSTKPPYYTIYNSTFVINSNFWLDSESTLPCTTTSICVVFNVFYRAIR